LDPRPVSTGSPSYPGVALTFDDGPDGMQTRNVLRVLAREHAPATFFLAGRSIERNPSIARETADAGHEIANHGYRHYSMTTVPPLFVWSNIAMANELIEAVTGVRPRYFRPPHGAWNDTVVSCAAACGLQTILWNVTSGDWHAHATVQSIAYRIATAGAGSIVLCHDKGPRIAEALRRSIPLLREQGLELVTVKSLLEGA
jgi:peptidoglycan/xylan/chitin deacetylase (PgdA/CDA1 family)